jgi:hypothetical protein
MCCSPVFSTNLQVSLEVFLFGRVPSGQAVRSKSSLVTSLRAIRFHPSRECHLTGKPSSKKRPSVARFPYGSPCWSRFSVPDN